MSQENKVVHGILLGVWDIFTGEERRRKRIAELQGKLKENGLKRLLIAAFAVGAGITLIHGLYRTGGTWSEHSIGAAIALLVLGFSLIGNIGRGEAIKAELAELRASRQRTLGGFVGLLLGGLGGGYLGSSIGIAGAFGAISGLLPCAVVGAVVCGLIARRFGGSQSGEGFAYVGGLKPSSNPRSLPKSKL